jgi:hypothetical protein
MNSFINDPSKVNNEVLNRFRLSIFRAALKSLAKFIGFGFGGAIGCYFLMRQWLEKDWQAFLASIGVFVVYTLVSMTIIAFKKAVSEYNYRMSLENELAELRNRKEEAENRLRVSGLYQQNDVQIINELNLDGVWLSDSIIEIEVIGNGELGIISHWNKEAVQRNTTFTNYEAEASVLEIPSGHKWYSKVTPKSSSRTLQGFPNYVDIQFYIDPPLKNGDRLRYRYTQKYKGTVILSSKDLVKAVKSRRFFQDLLKDIKLYSILSPTKRFRRSILFHDSSLISNVEVVALYRDALDKEETDRARSYFTVTARANNQTLACLDIQQPKTGYMYGIMWSLTR